MAKTPTEETASTAVAPAVATTAAEIIAPDYVEKEDLTEEGLMARIAHLEAENGVLKEQIAKIEPVNEHKLSIEDPTKHLFPSTA